MTGQSHPRELLAAAASVLRRNSFDVQQETLQGSDAGWLIAESELFVVAVAAARDVEQLRDVESYAAPELIERLRAAPALGGKRWDAYLVLMASVSADDPADATQPVNMEYDTRGVRRLVAVAVEPTEDDLRRVLRPFMALPPPLPGGLSDAFEDLEEQLVLNGVGEDEAHHVVAAFQDKGHLNDV